jgi:hypothetical protein
MITLCGRVTNVPIIIHGTSQMKLLTIVERMKRSQETVHGATIYYYHPGKGNGSCRSYNLCRMKPARCSNKLKDKAHNWTKWLQQ